MDPKPKKLAKKFVATRLSDISAIPVTWNVKKLIEQKFLDLDLRLCGISSLKQQCTFLFDVGANLALDAPHSSERNDSVKKIHKSTLDEKDRLFHYPSWILQLDISLNVMQSLTIEDLSPFVELRSLNLSLNFLKHFSGIAACPYLSVLCLAYNDIDSLPYFALQQCKHLYKLDLHSNKIKSVSGMPALSKLEFLNLNHNKLESTDGLQCLPSLRSLLLRHNRLEDVVSLSACSSMKHLDLSHNKLTSIEEITTSFTHLKFLQQLDITDNPASELPFKELLAIVSKDTTAVVLNGANIGSMQEQFAHLKDAEPPSSENPLRLEIKEAVRNAMKSSLDLHRKQHHLYTQYLHKKLLSMASEMDEFQTKIAVDTEAWCSYVDTLSHEELKGFSLSQIQVQLSGNAWTTVKDLP